MKVFVAMPFAQEFNPVYNAVKSASADLGLTAIRVDEMYAPGPIVQQIFKEISESDFVIAEISNKNPNVYYEVGLAHCTRKPTLLLANKASISSIPFDIRHNRVFVYDSGSHAQLEEGLKDHLRYFIHHLGPGASAPTFDAFFDELGTVHGSGHDIILKHVQEIAKEYKLTNAGILEKKYSPDDGYVITVQDDFGDKVVFTVDVNGIRRRDKKLLH